MTTVAVAACGEQERPTPAAAGSDLVRARYKAAVPQDGQDGRLELEVIADGDRRVRVAYVSVAGTEGDDLAGGWAVWDGRALLTYEPASEPKYTRTEDPDPGQRPTFVFVEGSEDFERDCPEGRRLGTHVLLGRTAVRYACAAANREDRPVQAHELSVDQATGLLLKRADPAFALEATEIELNPTVAPDTFSTDLPAGVDAGARIEPFRLPRVGGGELALTDYPPPLVIVAGDAAGIRTMLDRLLPLTRGGTKPQVIGLLTVIPPPDWKGSLLNPKDAASLAEQTSKAAGTFPVPVAINFKGAAAYPITQQAGVEAGQTRPTAVGFIDSDSILMGTVTDTATDDELQDRTSTCDDLHRRRTTCESLRGGAAVARLHRPLRRSAAEDWTECGMRGSHVE